MNPDEVETNIVMFDITDGRSALDVLESLADVGVRMVPFGPTRIRATTHGDVSDEDILTTLELCSGVLAAH